jgi:RNA polymerase sigma factor (sigma-70 family)
MKYTPPSDIDPEAKELIRHKARRMADDNGFRQSDVPDLRQELSLAAHLASSKYDPRRADPVTFYSVVVEHKATDLVRRQTAKKRDRRLVRQIETSLDPCVQADPRPATELRLDVRDAIDGLRPDDRDVAVALADHTVMEIARRPGRSREQVRGARRRIRRHLAERGLR